MALPLYPSLVSYVLANMRACDAAEVWPVCPRDLTPGRFAEALCRDSALGRVFLHDDIPACAVGAAPQQPGVWSPWMMATDAWPHVWREVVRYIRYDLTPEMIARGCHRAHVHSIVGHPDAGKLLRHLGFRCEIERLEAFGRDREAYSQWAYIVPESVACA
jgi:hypothetical protein